MFASASAWCPAVCQDNLLFCGRKFIRLSLLCLEAKQGVEFGTDWLLCEILREHLTQADTNVSLELSVAESYPETVNIDWITYVTATAIKELDPVSWKMAHSEWLDSKVSDGNLVTFGNGSNHYWVFDNERIIETSAANIESASD